MLVATSAHLAACGHQGVAPKSNEKPSPPIHNGVSISPTADGSNLVPVQPSGLASNAAEAGAQLARTSCAVLLPPKSNGEGTILPELCGNGKLDAYETCDDGNRNWGDGCSGICTAEAVDLLARGSSFCVLTSLGTVKCWGKNLGFMGYGDLNNRGDEPGEMGQALPTIDLGHVGRVTAVAGSATHACALLESGQIKCWGSNCYGQLGQPIAFSDRSGGSGPCKAAAGDAPGEMGDALPFVDLGSVPPTQLFVGVGYSCALLSSGQVKCWGSNDGNTLGHKGLHHLGDDAGEMGENLPVVNLGKGRRAIKLLGVYHSTCAILDDYQVRCWGDVYLKKYIHIHSNDQLVIGQDHSCILTKSGSVRCWGEGGVGQLGYPKLPEVEDRQVYLRDPPARGVNLGKGRIAIAVALDDDRTCALLDDHQLKCWGGDTFGALGIGGEGDERCFWDMVGLQPCRTTPPERPIDLRSTSAVKKVVMSNDSTCVLFEDARIKCWGYNGGGALGLGDTANRDRPPEQYVAY